MKKFIIILLTLFLVGCDNNDIVTDISESDDCIFSITYPITNYKKLNKQIKKYIRRTKDDFKKNYCSNKLDRQELNIDFKKNIINNYVNIKLIVSIDNRKVIKTFVYKDNKKISIYDILTENDLQILSSYINTDLSNLNFEFDEDNLYIYTDETIIIPLEEFDLNFEINKDYNINGTYVYNEVNKTIDKSKKTIALTFDDGPSIYTEKIIDLLNEYNASATFFVLGNKVKDYRDTLIYMLESGNEIGNHTYNHKLLTNQSDDEILYQINETQKIINETLDYTPVLFRPSYGSVNKKIRNSTNLDIILWNIDSLDWKYKNKTKIINHILPKIDNNKIILMHDTHKYTYDTLKELLPKLKDYQIVTVSELKKLNEG